jgi:hypothetical protein
VDDDESEAILRSEHSWHVHEFPTLFVSEDEKKALESKSALVV